ncbi:MlaD family protein [Pseudooceanicola sediminis]|nr:MlaD family protein [Pseudooceanicola sediminis]
MSDEASKSDTPEDVTVTGARSGFWERISLIWIVPVMALIIALGVAFDNYIKRGPLIQITFENAEGIAANETELRYRDLAVGVVEKVGFSKGLEKVQVFVRLDRNVADYVDDDAAFWVVRPEVTARGVTGLGTVLSGVYIQGIWNSTPGGLRSEFEGASQPPLNPDGRPGLKLRLRAAPDGSLTGNTPIEYRGIDVGQMGKAEISQDGTTIEADAIIFEPHNRLISSATRFWDTSGFKFSFGANGAELDFSSLATVLSGGTSFSTQISGGTAVQPGTIFTVYSDESAARASMFSEEDGVLLTYSAIFDENVPGLSPDSQVTYGGLRIGQVSSVNGFIDPERFGDDKVRLAVTMQIRPARLGLDDTTGKAAALKFFADHVAENGLRARLATASILTGGLKIEIVEVPDAPEATVDTDADPFPIFPTAPSRITDVSASADGIFKRISALPIEQLMNSAVATLDNISRLTGSDDIRAVPGEVRALLGDARDFVESDALQALPGQIGSIATEVEKVVLAINTRDAVGRIVEAIDNVSKAAGSVSGAVAGVPQLVQRIDNVAAGAETVPLDQLAQSLDGLLQSADAFVGTPEARALPGDVSAALDELRRLLAELRNGGLIENANTTMLSAREAADSIAGAADDLPAMMARVRAVLDRAGTTLQGYDAQSGVGREATDTLREVQRAAAAISALARELQRNPNSLLFGR